MPKVNNTEESIIRTIIRWGLYPASWALTLFGFYRFMVLGQDPGTVWAQTSVILLITFMVIEFRWPYQARWSMTWRSFFADLKFIIGNAGSVAAITAGLAYFSISISGTHHGPATDWPIWAQLVMALLIFEAINYSIHRAMHELRGPIGRFLWRTHAAHHLPPRLYILMHAVFHPLNAVIIQGVAITLPIWLMGYGVEATTMFLMINGLHGLISHFNVDIRAGFMNYMFVGTELHRYHHSADVNEAKNFGATLPIYDIMFGSFVYHPGVPPAELGVDANTGLPPYERFFAVMALPFQSGKP
jgi:sterol desaturase/sphingolipid hydroxylase (fatty acid hydroxylase superfamily)